MISFPHSLPSRRVIAGTAFISTVFLLTFFFWTSNHSSDRFFRDTKPDTHPDSTPSSLPAVPFVPLSEFTPFTITKCTPSTPHVYAPCRIQRDTLRNAVYGEELIYPAFRLSPPIFSSNRTNDRETWKAVAGSIADRAARNDDGSMTYPEQHGQTYVFENVKLSQNTVFDSWASQACMSPATSTNSIVPLEDSSHIDIESAILANSPDSAYFQHFLDRVTHILIQASSLPFQPAYAITGQDLSQQTVRDVWEMLGFNAEHVLHRQTGKAIGKLIWSCRTPLIHPHFSLAFQQKLFHLKPVPSVPIQERKTVVYMSRSNGQAHNGGRQVLNEKELLVSVTSLLQSRNKGEELYIWDSIAFGSTQEMIEWVHEHVSCIISPHGGSLYNHMWASQDTLVVELQPHGFQSMIFYEGAKTLNQKYAVMHLPDASPYTHDMNADLDALQDILTTHLGTPLEASQKIKDDYAWPLED